MHRRGVPPPGGHAHAYGARRRHLRGAAQAVDSAIAQQHLAHRLGSLDVEVPGLSFGRLDEEEGARWYVGRRHVEDDRGDPVVVDWRADVAVPFYRATAVDPLGLRRRRRFAMTGRRVDDLFDEVFDDPDSVDAAHHGGIPDPLLAELERERTGEMRDIVATIAAEQDEVIRAPLDTCLVVQGGPGTGKTAVGLHRAAFLLYEHRRQLDAAGVLVVGPNPIFLRYIGQVLPSLGETAVRQTTLERLLAGTAYRRRGVDGDPAARIKGDARMATVLASAVAATVRPPERAVEATTAWGTVRLGSEVVAEALTEIRARGVPHNVGRAAVRARLVRLVRRELAARRGEEVTTTEAVDASLRADRGWQRALDRIWPPLNAAALVRRLLTNRDALRTAAAGLLDAGERASLARAATRRVTDEPWTLDDLALLDEAEILLVGLPPAYGHVVVDEAQDLSAMGFRALARRSPARSMTVLGDLAQATAPGAQSSWDEVVAHLGAPATARAQTWTSATGCRPPSWTSPTACWPRRRPASRPAGPSASTGDHPGSSRSSRRSAPTDYGTRPRRWRPSWPVATARWPSSVRPTWHRRLAGSGSTCWRHPTPRASSSTRSSWWNRPPSRVAPPGGCDCSTWP